MINLFNVTLESDQIDTVMVSKCELVNLNLAEIIVVYQMKKGLQKVRIGKSKEKQITMNMKIIMTNNMKNN